MSEKTLNDLKEFLKGREFDIANDIEDFGILKGVFIDMFNKEANGDF